MKGTVHQEEISTLKIYAPKNPGVSIYIKKKTVMTLRAQIDLNIV
jgi:hypothetical protein